ncbi:unnamed protein product, partial [Discosporangium mesarthrocarpum]
SVWIPPPASRPLWTPSDVDLLVDMGFGRPGAEGALELCRGNVDKAAVLLLEGPLIGGEGMGGGGVGAGARGPGLGGGVAEPVYGPNPWPPNSREVWEKPPSESGSAATGGCEDGGG